MAEQTRAEAREHVEQTVSQAQQVITQVADHATAAALHVNQLEQQMARLRAENETLRIQRTGASEALPATGIASPIGAERDL